MPRLNGAVLVLSASALLAFARSARAEQFVLIDATFDYTWDDALNAKPDKSHFYVTEKNFLNLARPKNWLSPLDYRNGTLHVRTEVFEKPAGDQQVGWTLCYIANVGNYGCADTTYYKSTGVFDRETKMTDFWQNETIQWDQGIKQVDLIYAINDSGSGHVTNYPALKDLTTPTRVRITMVQVSAGSTYDPSLLPMTSLGGAGGAGAGAGAGGANGAGAGGASGSGGALAMGGAASGGAGGLLSGAGSAAVAGGGAAGNGASSHDASGGAPSSSGGGAGAASPSSGGASNPGVGSSGQAAGCALSPARCGAGGFGGGLAAAAWLALALRARRRLRARPL